MHIPAFIKKISILLVGSGLAQALNFVLTSFLTRKYLPEQFGAQVVFLTISFYFSVAFTGKYELAVVIPRETHKARALVRLCTALIFSLGILSIPLFYFFGDEMAIWFQQTEMAKVSWMIPISIIGLGLSSIFNYWHTREENYKLLSAVRIIETVLTGGLALLLFGVNSHGLILGSIIGTGLSVIILIFFFRNKITKENQPKNESIKSLAIEYKDFPKSNVAISLIDAFQFTGITLLISYYFGPTTAGYFALCNRILQAPIGLVIKPITQIFFSESSKLFREQKPIYQLTMVTVKRTSFIAFPILFILVLAGPFVFSLVFGANWAVSGTYAQILICWFFLEFIKAPISQLAVILRKQRKMLIVNAISLVLFLILPVFIKFLEASPINFLIYTSAFHIGICAYMISWYIQLAKDHDSKLLSIA